MDHLLGEAVEKKRQKLINKLMTFEVFKVDQKQLFELSLLELRNELKRVQKTTHPHSGMNSIKWVNF
jgi:hypothetical protein